MNIVTSQPLPKCHTITPSQGFQNQDLCEVKEEEPQVGIEQIHAF